MKPLKLSLALTLLAPIYIHTAMAQDKPISPSDPAKSVNQKQDKTAAKKEKPQPYQRGTKNAPVFLEGEITTKKTKEDENSDTRDKQKELELLTKQTNYTLRQTLIAAFMFALATAQLLLFWWQLRQMRLSTKIAIIAAKTAEQTAQIMRNTAERQLRAYVGVKGIQTRYTENETQVRIVMLNSGHTPAANVQCTAIAFIPPQSNPTPPAASTSTLFPGNTADNRIIIGLSEEHMRNPQSPELFLCGTITYRHVFSKDVCSTDFRYKWDCQHQDWAACQDGNDAN